MGPISRQGNPEGLFGATVVAAMVGRGRVLREGSGVAILGYGTIVRNCLPATQLLQGLDISITVADARFCKPLDGNLIRQLAQEHEVLITVEEGSIGGFSSHVSHFLGLNGLLDGNLKITKLERAISVNIIDIWIWRNNGAVEAYGSSRQIHRPWSSRRPDSRGWTHLQAHCCHCFVHASPCCTTPCF